TRHKHDPEFPQNAVDYCLREAGLTANDLSYVAFYDKPLRKFERLLETYLAFAPSGFGSFRQAMPVWLKDKLHLRRTLREKLKAAKNAKFVFTEHHESHAASAFFPCPFEDAAVLTVDGVGEWGTASIGVGEGNRLRLLQEMRFPHSLGLLYSAFTYYCGFKVNSGEYKLMGLAPYGKPLYHDKILDHLIDLKADGSFRMDMDYFNYCQGLTMTNERFDALFGGPPRKAESVLEQRHMDIAASIQKVTEEVMIRMAKEARRQTGKRNLVLAGGVALNCVANGVLLRQNIFDDIWVQPAAGDAGGALGAALFVWHQLLDKPRNVKGHDLQKGSLIGPQFSNETVAEFIAKVGAPSRRHTREEDLLQDVSQLMAQGKVIGWFHGRMEFGPRALGARSIIGDPRDETMQSRMNLKIKFRESFRPFAPCVLQERVSDYFEMKPGQESPYMLMVAQVREQHRAALSETDQKTMAESPDLMKRVTVVRSTLPAITHVDYSARVQTVDEARHGRFYRLMKAFETLTGCGVIVNTSFNVRGEPIVCTPEEAYRCFLATGLDALVLEDFILEKDQMTEQVSESKREQHLAQFEAD
ncbi:MAG TPA: carbamoyltransferase N-terminal domain-containing protein, partial [Verrucomicrobiae bacterium]|nr:carbamoyltransferase N-terminal domain-containing protein [Verrucomicrobiae bacterium]